MNLSGAQVHIRSVWRRLQCLFDLVQGETPLHSSVSGKSLDCVPSSKEAWEKDCTMWSEFEIVEQRQAGAVIRKANVPFPTKVHPHI